MGSENSIAPTKNRIEVLDVLRGFAILGIVLANIQSWSGYKFIPFEQLAVLPNYSLDHLLHYCFNLFVDTKFYTIFSLLFGIGFYLQFKKHVDNQPPFMKMYRRRLGFLMMFGAIHAFFWSGDILFIYGAVGFVFVLFRNLSEKKLLFFSIFFFYIWLVYDLYFAIFMPGFLAHPHMAYKNYADVSPWHLSAMFEQGDLWMVLQANWHNLFWRYIDLIPAGRITKVLAIFLLGYYLMKIDYFNKYATSKKLLALYFAIGLGISSITTAIGGSMASFPNTPSDTLWKFFAATGQLALALGYVQTISILYKNGFFAKLLHPLSYVGKMSFSNYILHTVAGYFIFYPFFGGRFGTMGLLQIMEVAVIIYLIEIVFSYLWLKYCQFGPLEWVWRCLTYKKLFPLKRA